MPTDEPFTPPKKKPNVLWWLGGGFALLVFLFFLQLFGPNPRIIVSPQTTHITSPLSLDGLPDYEQYTLDLYRAGVTPENNAAVLLVQALWPVELDPSQYAAVVTELGLEHVPSPDEALVHLYDKSNRERVTAWLRDQAKAQAGNTSPTGETPNGTGDPTPELVAFGDDPYFQITETLIDHAMSRPWTSAQFPPLAKWIVENKAPLDLIVQATRRPRLYLPSPSLIDKEHGLLVAMLLPAVQSVREVGRALPARAMWRLGEGRPMAAWEDVLAVHRMSRLLSQGRTLVEQLVAIAMSGIACDRTLTLLHRGNLTVEQARQVQSDLAAIPPFGVMARSLDEGERLSAVDSFVRIGGGDSHALSSATRMNDDDFGNTALNAVSVDWNLVLQETNRWYDRLSAAASLPDRAARRSALAQLDADVRQFAADVRVPSRWFASAISRGQRSKLVASIMLSQFLPALHACVIAEDRDNNTLDLTRLAAALAVYRAEHGAYPEKLDEMVPGVVDQLPVDLYNGKPFIYRRTEDGYLLYSMGENGVDDGGSSEMMGTLKGQSLNELNPTAAEELRSQIPTGADDMSIRVPRPKWELPRLPSTDEQ